MERAWGSYFFVRTVGDRNFANFSWLAEIGRIEKEWQNRIAAPKTQLTN